MVVETKVSHYEATHFELRARDIVKRHKDDPEACGSKLDDLMLDTLSALGFKDGVEVIRDAERYFA